MTPLGGELNFASLRFDDVAVGVVNEMDNGLEEVVLLIGIFKYVR